MSSVGSFFLASRHYIVVGASSNPDKYGFKVLSWYINHNLPVTPVNPTSDTILGIKTAPSIFDVLNSSEHLGGFGVSFITPPRVTLDTINKLIARNSNKDDILKAFWFQPGSFDEEVVLKARELKVKTIIDDDCILVNGAYGLSQARL